MQSQISTVTFIIIAGTCIVLVLLLFISVFIIVFQRRQIQFKQEKSLLKSNFEKEILHSQLEVQNLTMQQIGAELHDNIGQILSVAKINLNQLEAHAHHPERAEYILQANELVGQAIIELRAATKSLDGDFIKQFGLIPSIENELERISKTKQFSTHLALEGPTCTLGFNTEIVLFRIFQEFINNTIKHSKAHHIHVKVTYSTSQCKLTFWDDGIGFNIPSLEETDIQGAGAGLRNITRRSRLIDAHCEIKSQPGLGTTLILTVQTPNVYTTPMS